MVITGILLASCSPQIYKANNFDSIKSTQKIVAVLPFETSFDLQRLPKGVQAEDLQKVIEFTSYSIQTHAYFFLLDKTYIKNPGIRFQDFRTTNEILEESGVSYEELMLMDKGELCEKLGVDGVISGNIRMNRPMSDGAALITGVFSGVWGTTHEAFMTMTIHDKVDSKLLWRYSFQARGTVGSSSQKITRRLIKNVARHFPYRQ